MKPLSVIVIVHSHVSSQSGRLLPHLHPLTSIYLICNIICINAPPHQSEYNATLEEYRSSTLRLAHWLVCWHKPLPDVHIYTRGCEGVTDVPAWCMLNARVNPRWVLIIRFTSWMEKYMIVFVLSHPAAKLVRLALVVLDSQGDLLVIPTVRVSG